MGMVGPQGIFEPRVGQTRIQKRFLFLKMCHNFFGQQHLLNLKQNEGKVLCHIKQQNI